MGAGPVLTLGLGDFSGVSLIPTLGYGTTVPDPGPVPGPDAAPGESVGPVRVGRPMTFKLTKRPVRAT
jgi:hypothetical protein